MPKIYEQITSEALTGEEKSQAVSTLNPAYNRKADTVKKILSHYPQVSMTGKTTSRKLQSGSTFTIRSHSKRF
jgi:hypothetical protein